MARVWSRSIVPTTVSVDMSVTVLPGGRCGDVIGVATGRVEKFSTVS